MSERYDKAFVLGQVDKAQRRIADLEQALTGHGNCWACTSAAEDVKIILDGAFTNLEALIQLETPLKKWNVELHDFTVEARTEADAYEQANQHLSDGGEGEILSVELQQYEEM